MKIALVGSRVGYIDRGFESFSRSLFDLLSPDIDITLFKGGGSRAKKEVVISTPWCEKGVLSRLGVSHNSRVLIQERAFAVGMLPHLFGDRFDIIHFSEVVLGKMLLRLRGLFGLRYRLLFSNGAPAPPLFYERFDTVQEVNGARMDDAIAYGLDKSRLHLVPYGIDCGRFRRVDNTHKAALRRKHSLPEDRIIVLCAAAIKRHHKRIDWLIKEFAGLDKERFFLVVAGHRTEETAELESTAASHIGGRFRFLTLSHDAMHEMYQVADIFALPSLVEGLPIVVLEAMASSLPVVTHNDRLFCWAVGRDACTIDMAEPGSLCSRLRVLGDNAADRRTLGESLARATRERFDWQSLKPQYVAMYESALRQSLRR